MPDLAIRAQDLGKQYRIGAAQPRYKTLRESLVDSFAAPFRFFRKSAIRNPQSEILWALKDVSFEIKPGEVVGVIGRNGAGKSTLLRILSRITEPTEGRAEVHGRVGSLLEVGTGFHPELTGRENIYLSGAILGMKRAEINRRFDEMVAFAEVEKFVDTPVKHYSTGMYLRLAFAVAAHLEPEILLVDEVLAVGDVAFQKKCLGKMQDVSAQGRTVLFVTHNMSAVLKLCRHGMLLDHGCVVYQGDAVSTVNRYLEAGLGQEASWVQLAAAPGEAVGTLTYLSLVDDRSQQKHEFKLREPWTVRIGFEMRRACDHVIVAVALMSGQHGAIATQWSQPQSLAPGKYVAEYRWYRPTLAAGHYHFTLGLSMYESAIHYLEDQGRLVVSEIADGDQPVRASNCGMLVLDDDISLMAEPRDEALVTLLEGRG